MSGPGAGGRLKVAVLDYGIGNLRSAQKGLQRVGVDAHLTADHDEIAAADGVVLPGVGNFGACIDALHAADLAQVAIDAAASGRPFLGICVGMQMLYEGSEESPDTPGLGILPGTVHLLPEGVKRPQMQWNRLDVDDHPLFGGLQGSWMYFVHSYAAEVNDHTIATTDYGGPVCAAAAYRNVWATQFHPEKSADAGKRLAENWVAAVAEFKRTGTVADAPAGPAPGVTAPAPGTSETASAS